MAGRITQVATEALTAGTAINARVTQETVEVVTTNTTTINAVVTQVAVEVLTSIVEVLDGAVAATSSVPATALAASVPQVGTVVGTANTTGALVATVPMAASSAGASGNAADLLNFVPLDGASTPASAATSSGMLATCLCVGSSAVTGNLRGGFQGGTEIDDEGGNVRFGAAVVTGVPGGNGWAMLGGAFNNLLPLSSARLPLKGYPLSLYDAGRGLYALGVVIETSVPMPTDRSPTFAWRGQKFVLAEKDGEQYLAVDERHQEDMDAVGLAMVKGMPMAVNTSNSLIMRDSGLDPLEWDQEERLFLGTNTFTVRRYGNRWYLVVAVF